MASSPQVGDRGHRHGAGRARSLVDAESLTANHSGFFVPTGKDVLLVRKQSCATNQRGGIRDHDDRGRMQRSTTGVRVQATDLQESGSPVVGAGVWHYAPAAPVDKWTRCAR